MSEDQYRIIFTKNLKYYMESNGKNQMDLMRDLGLSSSTVSSWCTGQKLPRMNKIEMLANYFGVEKSALIEEHHKEADGEKRITLLARRVESMPDDDREFLESLIESTIDTYLENRKKRKTGDR